jgi:hypothetical protein
VQPYLDDLKRRARARSPHAATEIGLGLLLGLYACREVDDNDRLLTHAVLPDAVDDLALQLSAGVAAANDVGNACDGCARRRHHDACAATATWRHRSRGG